MEKKTTIWIAVIVLAVALFVGFRYTGNATAEPGKYNEFAQCLTSSGAKMYGAFWCSHCSNQKKLFGDSFNYVDYVECDARGTNGNPDVCDAAEITGYPTWIFGDGSKVGGELPLRELAFRSGCALPS